MSLGSLRALFLELADDCRGLGEPDEDHESLLVIPKEHRGARLRGTDDLLDFDLDQIVRQTIDLF